jgi:phage shock protein A
MKESLASRIGRLLAGSAHFVVEAVENAAPEVVMEQALREVDGALAEVRADLGRTVAAKHLANKRLAEQNRQHEELSEQVELAFAQGREDLAEAAIAAQLDIEAQIPVLEAAVVDGVAREKELEGYVHALLARRRQMEVEVSELRQVRREPAGGTVDSGSGVRGDLAGGRMEARVEQARRSFERAREQATGLAVGVPTPALVQESRLAELEELARQHRIRERVAALRAKRSEEP